MCQKNISAKSWPGEIVSATAFLRPHTETAAPLSHRTRHTARRQWPRGCGLISRGRHRARFRFPWGPPSRRAVTYFSAPLLLRPSLLPSRTQTPPQSAHPVSAAEQKQRAIHGGPGSPLRAAVARPPRAVGRLPVVVGQEGALRRQGQLQPAGQARRRQAAVVRVQAVPLLPRWHAARRLRLRPAGPVRPGGHRRLHRAQVAGLRRGDQRPLRHAGRGGRHRPGDLRQAGHHPGGDRAAVVQDGGHPARGHLQLLGRLLHALRLQHGAHGLRRAPPPPGLVQPGLYGQAVLPRPREVPRRLRRPLLPRGPALQPARLRQDREGDEGAQAQGDQERQARHARHPRLLHPGARHRRRTLPEPARPPRRPRQQQRAHQPQVPLDRAVHHGCAAACRCSGSER